MIRIVLPDDAKERNLPFYLAMEEWVAKHLPSNEYFFSWIVGPAVIIGRNQDMQCEVNQEYCSEHGIKIHRRKSGGGCVYTDYDNIMLSYVCPGADVQVAFGRFADMIQKALLEIDLNATRSERNDVLVDGRKLSGCAFYRLPNKSIVHGTLLFDTNMENMVNAITPDRSKLLSHKVQSVAQRITTVKEHIPYLKIDTFRNFINSVLADEEKVLTPEQVAEIEEIEKGYYEPNFLYGVHGNSAHRAQVPNAGHFNPIVNTVDGKISSVELVGDYFTVEDVHEMLAPLIGVACNKADILQALHDVDVSKTILNLDNETLAEMIENAKSQY